MKLAIGLSCLMALGATYAPLTEALSVEKKIEVPWRIIPKDHIILSRTTVKLRMSEQRFGLFKVMSPDGKKNYEVAVNEQGKLVNFDAIRHRDEKQYRNKYGKISPILYNKMMRSQRNELIPVSIWVTVDEEAKVDKSQFDAEQLTVEPHLLSNYRQYNQEARLHLRTLLNQDLHVEVQAESQVAPVLYVELNSKQVQQLNSLDEVAGLFLHETEGFDDLTNSMAISNADDVVDTLGWDGTGARVCVWESGPDNLTNLNISGHYTDPWPGSSWHARLVTGIIRNIQSGTRNGYAPDATIYSANSYARAALEWCVDTQTSRIVNQSFHRDAEQTSGDLSEDDLLNDYMVVHPPYPTIVQASGNGDSNEYVNHKGYNCLTVGSHDDTATAMASSSVFRNPNSPHDDRELPELAANGTEVSVVGLTASGTSFAAPAVAGTVALLHEVNSTLTYWPEGNRAILLAGATQNVVGDTWYQDVLDDVDARDGSGALNAEESVQIATNKKYENNSASRRGWNVGTLSDSSFDNFFNETTFSYNIQVPSTGGTHVKAALAWDSKVTQDPASSELAMDLDLRIYDGSSIMASSASWDNSYEIAEFDGVAGKTYTIKIKRWAGAGESSYYGIAWTVN